MFQSEKKFCNITSYNNSPRFFFLPLQAQDENRDKDEYKRAYIEWEPIEGAVGYYVDFRSNTGEALFRIRAETSKLDIKVPYGAYQYRIAIISKFDKIIGWTKWHKLKIVPALMPEFSDLDPQSVYIENKKNTITIHGKNFYRKTKIVFIKDDKEMPIERTRLLEPDTIAVDLISSKLSPGQYDLIIKNPGNLNITRKKVLLVGYHLKPEIISIKPNVVFIEKKRSVIVVKGRNFYDKTEVYLKNSKSIISPEKIEYRGSDSISFEISVSRAPPGAYDVIVKNPGDLKNIKNNFFTVKRQFSNKLLHYCGLEGGYFMAPLGAVGAYGGFYGGGLYYENHSLYGAMPFFSFLKKIPNAYLGIKFLYFNFIVEDPDFGPSIMMQGSVYGGYNFKLLIIKKYPWYISPFLGYKYYYRVQEYNNQKIVTARPIFMAGSTLSFTISRSVNIGLVFEYNLIFELTPLHTFGIFTRFGYRL